MLEPNPIQKTSAEPGKSLIICDDNATFVLLMKQIFAKKGFTVGTASDGEDGLSLVRRTRPDFLLLDLEMPSMGGMQVLESLGDLDGKRPYTVIISAVEGSERRKQAETLGAKEIWKKPFNAAELVGRIETLSQQGLH